MRFLVIFLIIFFANSCTHSSSPLIELVDKAIAEADLAQKTVESQADTLESQLKEETDASVQFENHLKLSSIYVSFDIDKSLSHLKNALEISTQEQFEENKQVEVLIRLASLYNSQGLMLKDAWDIFSSLEKKNMSKELRLQYYILGVQLYRSLASNAFDGDRKAEYRQKVVEYRDSVVKNGGKSAIIEANQFLESRNYDQALSRIKSELPDTFFNKKEYGPLYHTLARIYRHQGQTELFRDALAMAAICDLTNGVREYRALTALSLELMKEGDVERGYTFIHRAAKDAAESGARSRQNEIANILPTIDAAYERQQQKRKLNIFIACGFLFLFFLIVSSALFILRKRNVLLKKKSFELYEAHSKLKEFNASIQKLNAKLSEESRIKEEYIKSFMNLCLSYLQSMESYRAELGKIAAGHDWKTLSSRIKSSRYVNGEIDLFYNEFDRAFLSLYPDFVNSLNSLLIESAQYPQREELSTDLRIYALVRLGIESSGEIAKFLRISESTVYNYRTQMRNKAKNRQEFEEKIKVIS